MLFGHSRNTLKPACFPKGADVLRLWDNGATSWALINTAPGVYNWAGLDSHIAAAQVANIPLIYTFGHTPAFAQLPMLNPAMANANGDNAPADLGYLAQFTDALMAHVGASITSFETWNEWNAVNFYNGTLEHMLLQQTVLYSRIKKANPSAIVTTPTPCWNPSSQWPTADVALDAFLTLASNLSLKLFDVVTFHGYLANGADAMNIIPTIQAIKAVMAKHGVTTPLWDTEFGPNAPANIDPAQQYAWVIRSLLARQMNGVSLACWYQWDNQTHGTCTDLSGNLTTFGQAWVDYYTASKSAVS